MESKKKEKQKTNFQSGYLKQIVQTKHQVSLGDDFLMALSQDLEGDWNFPLAERSSTWDKESFFKDNQAPDDPRDVYWEDNADFLLSFKNPVLQVNEVLSKILPQSQQKHQICSKYLMAEITRKVQEKNMPRFLYRMIVRYFPEHQENFDIAIFKIIESYYRQAHSRAQANKKNVYLVRDIVNILDNEGLGEEVCKKNREIYAKVLRENTLKEMLRPKSQIARKNLVQYLKTLKIFQLRCRHKELVHRLQSP